MLTTAVISILVVQNRLLCERKVKEPISCNFTTYKQFTKHVFMRAYFKELILYLVLFITIYHVYYGPHITFVVVVAYYV